MSSSFDKKCCLCIKFTMFIFLSPTRGETGCPVVVCGTFLLFFFPVAGLMIFFGFFFSIIIQYFFFFFFYFSIIIQHWRSGPLVTCTGYACQPTGTSSLVSIGDLPVLPAHVTNSPDRISVPVIPIRNGKRWLPTALIGHINDSGVATVTQKRVRVHPLNFKNSE